jgi:hypothetical protein
MGRQSGRPKVGEDQQRNLSNFCAMATEDCPFKGVRTNGSDEVLARAINLIIGRAAFERKRMFPKDLIEFMRGSDH